MYKYVFFYICIVLSTIRGEDKVIEIYYKDQPSEKKLKVIITEYPDTERRIFSEEYIFFSRPPYHYIDKFFYSDSVGLFRKFNINLPILIGDVVVHIDDCLWIYENIYNNEKLIGTPSETITFSDRDYLGHWKYALINGNIYWAEKFEVKLIDMRYDSLYSDTIKTLLFDGYSPEQLGHHKEYKCYDSNFNMVSYTHVSAESIYDSTVYRIETNDYKRLKEFRKGFRSIFISK